MSLPDHILHDYATARAFLEAACPGSAEGLPIVFRVSAADVADLADRCTRAADWLRAELDALPWQHVNVRRCIGALIAGCDLRAGWLRGDLERAERDGLTVDLAFVGAA